VSERRLFRRRPPYSSDLRGDARRLADTCPRAWSYGVALAERALEGVRRGRLEGGEDTPFDREARRLVQEARPWVKALSVHLVTGRKITRREPPSVEALVRATADRASQEKPWGRFEHQDNVAAVAHATRKTLNDGLFELAIRGLRSTRRELQWQASGFGRDDVLGMVRFVIAFVVGTLVFLAFLGLLYLPFGSNAYTLAVAAGAGVAAFAVVRRRPGQDDREHEPPDWPTEFLEGHGEPPDFG
jgi:hypothetical protein